MPQYFYQATDNFMQEQGTLVLDSLAFGSSRDRPQLRLLHDNVLLIGTHWLSRSLELLGVAQVSGHHSRNDRVGLSRVEHHDILLGRCRRILAVGRLIGR
jgi:hypothetical protein